MSKPLLWIKKPYEMEYSTSFEEVESQVRAGLIASATTYGWHEGLSEWRLISDIVPLQSETTNIQDSRHSTTQALPPPKTYKSGMFSTLYFWYSHICLLFISIAIALNYFSYEENRTHASPDSDVQVFGLAILMAFVSRRLMWSCASCLRNTFKSNSIAFVIGIYVVFGVVNMAIYLFTGIIRSNSTWLVANSLSATVISFIFSIDIPFRAKSRRSKGLFESYRRLSVVWVVVGTLFFSVVIIAFFK